MASGINRLSSRQVETAKKPGVYSDGGGLYLRVLPSGGKRWILITMQNQKRREVLLGAMPVMTLAEARVAAVEAKRRIAKGEDPRPPAPTPEPKAPKTFGAYAAKCIADWEGGWKNSKHRQQWKNTIATYCQPIADKPLGAITTDDVLAIIQPMWLTKNETADRLRGRIERILAAARANNLIEPPYENPARYADHLVHLLPKYDDSRRGHFAALPYEEAPAFMARLRARSGMADRALEFTILTCVRSHMTRAAVWSEVKGDLWVVPKEKTKIGKAHTVPLTPRMRELMGERGDGLIFPGRKGELSDGALERPLDMLKVPVTVHGFRSTFKDWAIDMTDSDDAVSEECLCHTVGSKTKRAYRRREAIAKRLALLTEWGDYLDGR